MWQSVFFHDQLRLLLVIYVDDFKLAGPKEALAQGWKTMSSRMEIGVPEPFDRYFGCLHREALDAQLPVTAHPFSHVFDPTQDYWHHDQETRTWTRVHLQRATRSRPPP